MKAKLIKTNGNHYDLYVESIGLYTSTYQWTSNGNLLSRENCQEIERGYDLDELSREMTDKEHPLSTQYSKGYKEGIVIGFQKALELMGDKKFSEAQMREAYDRGFILGGTPGIDRYIQALQQTEWDVEVEMEFVGRGKHGIGSEVNHYMPKRDVDGCLILKLKSE